MRRRVYALAIVLLMEVGRIRASQLGLPSCSVPNTAGRHALARRLIVEGVPNFAEVTPKLYRGGQPTKVGFETLARMGIGIVVDLRGSRKQERDEVTKLGMKYIAIPWHCPFPKDDVFARFLAVIRQNSDKKIFAHCRLGNDRTGMMIAAFRMAEESWTAEEAMREMKAYGFAFSHHFICPGLAGYEKNFPRKYETSPVFRDLRDDRSLTGEDKSLHPR